jgi:hypothetical protein
VWWWCCSLFLFFRSFSSRIIFIHSFELCLVFKLQIFDDIHSRLLGRYVHVRGYTSVARAPTRLRYSRSSLQIRDKLLMDTIKSFPLGVITSLSLYFIQLVDEQKWFDFVAKIGNEKISLKPLLLSFPINQAHRKSQNNREGLGFNIFVPMNFVSFDGDSYKLLSFNFEHQF